MQRDYTVRERMVDDVRAKIVRGLYQPGDRMPTRAELERTYSTTPVTVQKVFDQLLEEGFVVARGRLGTFVADRPPHLCRYGLVFPYRNRPEHRWSHFWTALSAEAEALSLRNGHELVPFYGNETRIDQESYTQLESDTVAHRLAGLIFASRPFYLKGSPVLEIPGIPRVAIMPDADIPGVKAVVMDPSLFENALTCLLDHARRRIAVITVPPAWTQAAQMIRQHGLDVPSYWIQSAAPDAPEAARSMVRLLMKGDADHRPNGLFISDDNLVPPATEALRDIGIRVPEDMVVVAHCNFPRPTPSAVPAVRMGYDLPLILQSCLDLLDLARRNRNVPDRIVIPLRIDDSTGGVS